MLPVFEESDEFLNSLIFGFLILIVLHFSWRSTYVREDRPNSQAAVLVIDNNLRNLNQITQQPVTINILRSSSQQSNISNVTETEELDLENNSIASSIDNITQSILTEASESATGLDISDSEAYPSTSTVGGRNSLNEVDLGPEAIIRQMDCDLEDTPPSTSGTQSSPADEFSNRSQSTQKETAGSDTTEATKEQLQSKQIRIKLKYLNDDSKLVEGNLNEGIGEFKRRNFTTELTARKLVRLVFNGHVLQPDSKTLAACGLFDNCVVHCLIHNPKPQLVSGDNNGNGVDAAAGNGFNSEATYATIGETHRRNPLNRRTRYGIYFIYIGTLIFSVLISYCWYFWLYYGHLFDLHSTVGLILTTVIFVFMMPLIILTDRDMEN